MDQGWIQMASEAHDHAKRHGEIIKHMGQENKPDAVIQVKGRGCKSKPFCQQGVDDSLTPQQGLKSRPNHNCRQHKGNGNQGLNQALSRKIKPDKDPSDRKRRNQGQNRGERCLPEGEPKGFGIKSGTNQGR